MSLHPAVAAVRLAVRRGLADVEPGATVVVACSGGADSLALLAATVFEARKAGLARRRRDRRPRAAGRLGRRRPSAWSRRWPRSGVDETLSARVSVEGGRARAGGGRPAGAVRRARARSRERFGAAAVLLGHTRDDQAETVLLGLARGSGGRSLAGMRRAFDHYRRPLLDLSRARHRHRLPGRGHRVLGRPAQRATPRFTRVAGPPPRAAGARGASSAPASPRPWPAPPTSCAPTWTCSTTLAESAYDEPAATGCPSTPLAAQPAPVRRRVLRLAALAAGAPGLRALPRARAGDGRADHRLARPAVDRPARAPPLPAPRGPTSVSSAPS